MIAIVRGVTVGGFSLTALVWGLSLSSPFLRAQDKGLHAGEGQERLILDKNWSKEDEELKIFQAARRGDVSALLTPEIADHAAQWFAYRFTHKEYYEDVKPGRTAMHDLLKDALEQIVDRRDASHKVTEAQLQFKDQFDKRFIVRLQEVTKNPKAVARVNAVMILARLAASEDEEAVSALLEVVNDPKENDGIKLHAFRGIRDFFALGQGDNPDPFRNKEREGQCIAALLNFLTSKPKLDDDAPVDQKAALHYIRREAIAALGETRYPGTAKLQNKKTTIERPTALVLMRIMRKDGIDPAPTTEEQLNAAVGVCRLRARSLEQYHVDYAAEQLGRFIVDFVTAHNTGEQKAAWRLLAHRLSKALEEFRADSEGRQEAKYVTALASQAEELLRAIIDTPGVKPNPAKLAGWLEQNKPPKQFVYEGVADSVIHGGEKAAE